MMMTLIKTKTSAFILSIFLLAMKPEANGQTVPIIQFSELEHYLKPTDDNSVNVVNFWATWCKPCIEELPHFEKLNAEYSKHGVNVILVSLDFKSQYEKKVIPFIQKNNLQSKVVLLDTQGKNDFIDKVNPNWSGAIPATMVTQAGGKTAKFFEKQVTYEELENIVKPLIKL